MAIFNCFKNKNKNNFLTFLPKELIKLKNKIWVILSSEGLMKKTDL